MLQTKWLLLMFFVFNAARNFVQCCVCPTECTCSSETVSCEEISSFPECVPDGYTSLTISNSPYMTSIPSIPAALTYLRVSYTGLQTVTESAISNSDLTDLYFDHNTQLRKFDLGEPKNSDHPLQTLSVTNCTNLSELDNVYEYRSLVNIKISWTALKEIDDDMFKGLRNVKYMDLSHNHFLSDIDRDAFEDLDALEEIYLNDCRLYKLYSDYFDNAYHKNLKSVNTLLNPLKCYKMCDFVQWYWGHPSFENYASIGTCTTYSYGITYVYTVYNLNRYEAGCPTAIGVIIGATFGAFFFICIAACVFVVVCGIDYRKYCCFCCDSQRNRNDAENNRSDQQDQEHQYATVYQTQTEKAQINYPEGQMYTAAPPSYEDVTKAVNEEQTPAITLQDVPQSSST